MLIFKIEYCAMDFPTSEYDWALKNCYEEIHRVLLEIINRLNIKGIVLFYCLGAYVIFLNLKKHHSLK
jgi:hypothetical protein